MRIADFIIDYFNKRGAKEFFLLPGGGNMYLTDAIKKRRFKYLSFHHEQAAAIAAEGYTRINNSIGVAVVTSGPGFTNTLTAIAGSYIDSLPLVIISGQVKTTDLKKNKIRQNGPQEAPTVEISKPISKYSVMLNHKSDIISELDKAYDHCVSGRKGPVVIDVPLDIQAKKIKTTSRKIKNKIKTKTIDKKQIIHIFNLLKKSKRPLFYVGHGARLSGSKNIFLKILNKYKIPSVFTWNAKDFLESNSKLNLGCPGSVAPRYSNFAVQNCDLIIFLGARLNLINSAFDKKNFAKNAKKVFVDIDKYELDLIKYKKTVKLNYNIKDFLDIFFKQNIILPNYKNWIKFCLNQKNKYSSNILVKKNKKIYSHYDFVSTISDLIEDNAIIATGSSGLAIEIFYTFFKNKKNQRIFLTSGLGAMGYGLASSIGACVRAKKKTYLIESDGSLMFNLQELATIKSYNLPIVMIIMNNDGYASIRNTHRNYFKKRFVGTGKEDRIFYPNFRDVAKAFNIKYYKCSNSKDLNLCFSKIRRTKKPIFIDVKLKKDEILLPKVSAVLKGEKIFSLPLEDMSPLLSLNELKSNLIGKLNINSIKIRKKNC